ncbi:PREDICTED: vigilin-like [Branchiostoma belcheri]|uniref:Vigilin-like n=1 Tax=Branchiostoma belcheri TaxID=7741 RepID=A0A6P4ZUB0_BRABE|nr:PREDICTED: vigilin-like [Branchiostoma belcheri]
MSSDMYSEEPGVPDVGKSPRDLDEEAYMPTYAEAFPPLPQTAVDRAAVSDAPVWGAKPIKSSITTQVFRVPVEERRYKQLNDEQFGEEGKQQAKACQDIMKNTACHIEISLSKDQSLTIMVTGKQQDVMKARKELLSQLQTQAQANVNIPKEHYRYILGRAGKKLQDLEMATATKITIPRQDDKASFIKITGTKEGIERARHEIQLISDEQAKLAFERLPVPKCFHPFIRGPKDEILNQIIGDTGARINIPPPSVNKDELTVAGEKEAVQRAVQRIMGIYDEKKRKTCTISVEVRKSQHKYVIGPKGNNLAEIMATTGVSVEMPPLDTPTETILLRGEQDKLGTALTQVYARANSVVIDEVVAPAWLHRFIIGRKGQNIRQIMQDLPKVHIEFTDGQDKITLEGPPEEVEQARRALEEITRDLQSRMDFAELTVEQKYHRHIIGKNGANITRIKNETKTSIRIPPDEENSNLIRIEGDPAGVQEAKKEICDMVNKMENERTKDILIEQRFHRTIIGTKGEKIREVRDKFPEVIITFPEPSRKSDVVTLRGPKQDVDKCFKYLTQMVQEIAAQNYKIDVPIYKKFHKNIIGKGGATIRKIREETNTRIDLPTESSDSDVISIIGRKKDCEDARDRIQAIQNELANVTSVDINIPAKFHNSIIGAKGRLIRSIMEDCGGVIIRFPDEGSGSDKVTIRGPKEDVEKAKQQLLELSNERAQSGHTSEVRAKPEHHKFLIGRGGSNIRKVRDNTGARIIFPTAKDDDQELITIMGTKEAVAAARAELENLIKDLDKIVEGDVSVDPKFHRHFVARRGAVLREIADDFGGVQVSFPRSGVKSDKVVLKGAKDCVEGAKNRIMEIVADLESQVTIECVIAQKHHRTVMGPKGSRVQAVTSEFDVGIKFPDRRTEEPSSPTSPNGTGEEAVVNGDAASQESGEGEPKKSDIILITGNKDRCEQAKAALLALVPITEEVEVPFDYHRFIIGQKGRDIRKLMEENDVNITIPPANLESNFIKITGPPTNVERAKGAVAARVEELDKEKEDRMLRNFQLVVIVDPKYHPKIIGRKGAVISKIRQDHDVNIQFPDKGKEEEENKIVVTGYEKNAEAAKVDILKIVSELEDMVSEDVWIDSRVHPRLIGGRGRAIRKVMDDYKVDIRFPTPTADDLNIVTITGLPEHVEDCKDYLLNLEEEYMQDIVDQEAMSQYMKPSRTEEASNNRPAHSKGFVVRDAPWSAAPPDSTDTTEFPTLGNTASTAPPVQGGAVRWGPRR